MVYSVSASNGAIQWSVSLGTPAVSDKAPYTCNGGEPTIQPLIGITSTPVIDPSTSTLYVVAQNYGVGVFLFAINTNNGQTLWSKMITASGFNYIPQEQRGALALANGFVYIPFSSYSWTCSAAFGWLFAISANGNGTQYSHQVDTQSEGDIWAPEGVTVDSSGFIYIVTGNSYYNATYNYADSVLKFTPDLQLVSYFAPSNWAYLGPADQDLTTTGATLLPGNLIFSIGKQGIAYLLNSTDLGGIGGQLASLSVCAGGAWGSTAYANGVVYVPCVDGLHAVAVHGGTSPSLTSVWNNTFGFAGPAIVAGGVVLTVNIYGGELYALNPQTGATMSTLQIVPAGTFAHFVTPSTGGGLLFLGGNNTLVAISPSGSSSTSPVAAPSAGIAIFSMMFVPMSTGETRSGARPSRRYPGNHN